MLKCTHLAICLENPEKSKYKLAENGNNQVKYMCLKMYLSSLQYLTKCT